MTEPSFEHLWVYLSTSPLLGLTLTLAAYCLAHAAYQRSGANPLCNPVVLAVALIIALLWLSGSDYNDYFEGAKFVHFLLGPATVALAVPLYRQFKRIKALWLPIGAALFVGVVTGSLSAVLLSRWLGASTLTQLSLAPKSVTAPVAMGIAEKIGGLPSLTAVLVVSTGIVGAVFGLRILSLCGFKDPAVCGIALGVSAHGIGTARAFQVDAEMGAFSGLAMAIATVLTAFLLPWMLSLLALF